MADEPRTYGDIRDKLVLNAFSRLPPLVPNPRRRWWQFWKPRQIIEIKALNRARFRR